MMKIKKFIIDLYQFQNIIGIEIWNWILVYIITKAKRTTTKIVLIPSGLKETKGNKNGQNINCLCIKIK